MPKKSGLILLLLVGLLAACGAQTPTTAPPSPTPSPAPVSPEAGPTGQPDVPTQAPPSFGQGSVYISEVLPGVFGVDNNLEFIELYNSGGDAVDLSGWALWYQLADGKDEQLVIAWDERSEIPGQGYYLLARSGKDIGSIGDAEFSQSLFEKKGGLALRDAAGKTVDTLVWGEGPSDYVQGSVAPVPDSGASLERLPGGPLGSGLDTGDNGADFALNPQPGPQNSGHPLAPPPSGALTIYLELPAQVEPGSEVAYTVQVENLTGAPAHDVAAWLPVPEGFEVASLPEAASQSDGWVQWSIGDLADGAGQSATIALVSPWTYLSDLVRGAYVESGDWPLRAYGPVLPIAVQGGAIPIATARDLTGKTVTVEGIANMYTGGFYAGSTGTKFYLDDGSGGIQVYCPGGMGLVEVDVGDRVRATGVIEVYRDSVELIPDTYPDDVEVLEQGGPPPEAIEATVVEATSDPALIGRLISVEGLATRIEEFSYSYEVDLMDGEGNTLLAYIDKETGVTTEPMDMGQDYRLTGISEYYSGSWRIYPRYQDDIEKVLAPELVLEMQAPNSIGAGETMVYTLAAYNRTGEDLTNAEIEVVVPAGLEVTEVLDGGQQTQDAITWLIPELVGDGTPAVVRYSALVGDATLGQIEAQAASVVADGYPELVFSEPMLTFVSSGVPIWAIQGPGMTSPYVRNQATTEGIVIGVFPYLGGFWIQEAETDDDASTSAGLFVNTGEMDIPVALGDLVRITGKVREQSGQTLLQPPDLNEITILSSDNALPEAVALDPPVDDGGAQLYYEALEGMLVEVAEPAIAVAPTTKYGETALVLENWNIDRIMKGDPKGLIIYVDDGSAAVHYDLSGLPFALQSGDRLTSIAGPLAYTYENYKIEPITDPKLTPSELPLPALEGTGPGQFSIATFNVENLFDPHDPNPSDPPLPTTSEYLHALAKTADTIVAMGAPTIIGFQEVENLGILEDLAEEGAIAQFGYQPYLIEGTDSRGIDNGYLVRGDQATVEGAKSVVAEAGLTSRPPLLITTTIHLEDGDQTVYVLNNHFTSMSGGEKPTEPRRKAQAEWNTTIVGQIQEADPNARIVVLGDLNSFYESPPMDVMRQAGLRHAYELVEPDRPYTYIYQGESETLDHIWMTDSLFGTLAGLEVLHINADYPPAIPGDTSGRRSSDHDPVIAIFSFN